MSHGHRIPSPGWQKNNHWVLCDVCGFTYREDAMKERWDGAVVCKADWEPRHEQDLVHGIPDDQSPVGHIRTAPAVDTFVSVVYCISRSAVPNNAIPGCAIPGNTTLAADWA
jgi:hypothetical protein